MNIQDTPKALHSQDNRATAEPAFCVQVLERIGPLLPEFSDNLMFHDPQEVETYYPEHEEYPTLLQQYKDATLPDHILVGGYKEIWITQQVCFTEEGCKAYLAADGHNLRHYHGTRIYVESFRRNVEMTNIRRLLMAEQQELQQALSAEQKQARKLLEIEIPAVVSRDGQIAAALYRNTDGRESQATSLLWDGMPEGVPAREVRIKAALDLEALFKDQIVTGTVRPK